MNHTGILNVDLLNKDSCSQRSVNHSNVSKEGENQNMADEKKDCSASPPIECLVENIPQPMFNSCCTNEFPYKRVKMENDVYESKHMIYPKPHIEDDCDAFGRYVSTQLRQMSQLQKIFAQRLISEVCFRAQLQTLQVDTTLTAQAAVFPQHQSYPFYNIRPYFSRGKDSLMVQQHDAPHQNPIPVNINVAEAAIQHQNLINIQRQAGHLPGTINSIVNVNASKNIKGSH